MCPVDIYLRQVAGYTGRIVVLVTLSHRDAVATLGRHIGNADVKVRSTSDHTAQLDTL